MPFILFVLACVEIVGLVKLGQAVGGGAVLAEVLLTAVLGIVILRLMTRSVLQHLALNVFVGRLSLRALMRHELLPVVSGILLIVPGIVSDAFALYLLGRYFLSPAAPSAEEKPGEDGAIDVEYKVHEDDARQ